MNAQTRRTFLKTTGSSMALMMSPLGKALAAATAENPPNLLFIYADQYRRQAMGYWSKAGYKDAINDIGDPVVTPNFDRFADEGIVFTQCTSTHPVCSPYRGMMMTGMFKSKNGIEGNCKYGRDHGLNRNARCITDVLSGEGYSTAYFGKVHWEKNLPYYDSNRNYVGTKSDPGGYRADDFDMYVEPRHRHGIQYWYQSMGNDHRNPQVYSSDSSAIGGKTDGQLYQPKTFSTKTEADRVIDYLRTERDPSKPFSIIWAPNPPHNKYAGAEADSREIYKDKTAGELLNRPNADLGTADSHVHGYFSLVSAVDKHVGRVLDELETLGLKENTIVVFTSDHGDMMGSHAKMKKDVVYEESFGVPFMIRFPQKLQHRIEPLLMGSTDIMPTLLGLMGFGAKIPSEVQGVDYSPLLLDPTSQERPLAAPYDSYTDKGVRTDKYTMVVNEKGNVVSLFDNVNDPFQMTNLNFTDLPAKDQRMLREELGNWLARADDDWFKNKLHSDFVIYPDPTSVRHSGRRNARVSPRMRIRGTTISFRLSTPAFARVEIKNVSGRVVRTLVADEIGRGDHVVTWDGRNDRGTRVASGSYLCTLQSQGSTITRKLVVR